MNKHNLFHQLHKCSIPILAAVGLLIGLGCANIVPPAGGPKDETPPVLISIDPADSGLNTKPKKIIARFDKYMVVQNLEKEMQLSPLLSINPTVISFGKRVEITIVDSLLKPNTTYKFIFGNSLVDNREGNIFKNFNYTFSTGSYFDSLELKGRVLDAFTGMPDTNVLVTLYEDMENDSIVMQKKPVYITKTNNQGMFLFESLPQRKFKIFAIKDIDDNLIFDPFTEKIGFLDDAVIPSLNDSLLNIRIFQEIHKDTLQSESTPTEQSGIGMRKQSGANRRNSGYQVNVDTMSKERSFDLDKPLTIDLFSNILSIDTPKVYLSYDSEGIEVEALQKITIDSNQIQIHTEWQPDKLYTLRLVKGWAVDTSESELLPGRYTFRTKKKEDYASLKIRTPSEYFGREYLLYISKESDSIYLKPITDSLVTISLLKPGKYNLFIIADTDNNENWTTGNYLQKKQPEYVTPYRGEVILKEGWDNEIDFIIKNDPEETEHQEDVHDHSDDDH